jgi:hypothetical protein
MDDPPGRLHPVGNLLTDRVLFEDREASFKS